MELKFVYVCIYTIYCIYIKVERIIRYKGIGRKEQERLIGYGDENQQVGDWTGKSMGGDK